MGAEIWISCGKISKYSYVPTYDVNSPGLIARAAISLEKATLWEESTAPPRKFQHDNTAKAEGRNTRMGEKT